MLRYFSPSISVFAEGFIKSYGQIFFSNHLGFCVLLLIISFFDLGGGFGGMLSIAVAQWGASIFGVPHHRIRDGSITYNALMVGMAIGFVYQWNTSVLILILAGALLTLLLTLWFSSRLGNYGLPFLSLPFLFSVWIIWLGAPAFSMVQLNPKSISTLIQFYPELFENFTNWVSGWPGYNYWFLLFRSVGAIFFQYNDLAGFIILLGIFWFSRIAFSLAMIGFTVGYFFYMGLEGDFSTLIYSYIGFNFILTSMALGGFFLIPSGASYLLSAAAIPLIALMIAGFHIVFSWISLPLYSLPFNIAVLLILSAIRQGYNANLIWVPFQYYQPEKHRYQYLRNKKRFSQQRWWGVGLPIMGEWFVSQGIAGKITHKDDYQYAYDFDVRDHELKTYHKDGLEVQDFYCYQLPVLSPASGFVVEILDGIEDNAIGEVNLQQNWGNTIIIKHTEGLYSKLSHLKKGSFQVTVGQWIERGQIIAKCGNSGRSPEPHLHFQIQSTPFIGSATLHYPMDYFLSKSYDRWELVQNDYPQEGRWVQPYKATSLLQKALLMTPGKRFQVTDGNINETWMVAVNSLNQSYLADGEAGNVAYFVQDGMNFYFTEYYGSSKSLLFGFYQAAYRILLGYLPKVEMNDPMSLDQIIPWYQRIGQDFMVPFYSYLRLNYNFRFTAMDQPHKPTRIFATSQVSYQTPIRLVVKMECKMEITENGFEKIEWEDPKSGKKKSLQCVAI